MGGAQRISPRVPSKKDTSGDTCRLRFRFMHIVIYMMAINESMDKIASKLSFAGALIFASQEYYRIHMATYCSFQAPPTRLGSGVGV